MYLSWLPLIHLPRLFTQPNDAREWQFAAMALGLAGAVALSTSRLTSRPRYEEPTQ